MNFNSELNTAAWSSEHLGDALTLLACTLGWSNADSKPINSCLYGDTIDEALSWNAAQLKLETEAIESDYAGIAQLLKRCAPALLQLPDGGFLCVLKRRGKQLIVLTAELQQRTVAITTLQEALCQPLREQWTADVDELIAVVGISKAKRVKAKNALFTEFLSGQRVRVGWLLRPSASASLQWQAQDYRVQGLFGVLLGSHTLAFLLWLGAWWLLGQGVFSGHIDTGWLQAWVLLLITQLPLRLLASGASGLLAIRLGALLKRRLLKGALRLNPEEIRHLGASRLLACAIDAEVLEQMALTGGFLGLMGIINLLLSASILATVPDKTPVIALCGWVIISGIFAANYLRCQRRWTKARLQLTDSLVDGMVGHRTRAVQEPRSQWNKHEDDALTAYYQLCQQRDRASLHLRVTVPRGVFLLGLMTLVPTFASNVEASTALALGIAGILTASMAFRSIAMGVEQAASAWIAFEQIRPFWQAVTRPDVLGNSSAMAVQAESAIMEVRHLNYRHANRSELVLQGVDLCIHSHDRLLLQGASGSGKSTLAAILAGQRHAESGLCLANGLDSASLGEQRWRQRIALVPQFHENHIFMGTLAFNLLLGRDWPPSAIDIEDAEQLCKALGLGNLLQRMPSGLFQQVGETGWQLSHGERERVYIARALLQKADLLILDESVSSLDPKTLQETMHLLWQQAPALLLIVHA
jgi:ATP-binding cassette subfamily B protein